jgi:hypothetical protein
MPMRTEWFPASRLLRLAAAFVCAFALAWPATARAALCGDTGGDGFFTASDALITLRLAVTASYDRRGDVMPRPSVAMPQAGDGSITAVDALENLRAAVEGRFPPCHGAGANRAVVSTAAFNFSSGGFAVVDVATRAFHYRAGAIRRDSVVRVPSGIPVVVNRNGGNTLQLIDVEDNDLATINGCSVSDGFNSNPQDVSLLSDQKGYVTPYAGSELFVISPPILFQPELDPACDGIITDRIDLSAFDSDGVPQMDQMLTLGSNLFVSLQLLNDNAGGLPPKQNGVLAVIDTATDTVKGSIPLSFKNPFAETKGLVWDEFQQRIFVGGPGVIGDVLDDGGIEAVDPVAMQSDGMRMTGADIHANIFDFVIVGTTRAFAIIADKTSNSVVDLDIGADSSERGIRQVLLSSTSLITDIEMTERGELWVAYRGETGNDPSGIRIFRVARDRNSDNVELTVTDDAVPKPKPISLGQAPFTLAFID